MRVSTVALSALLAATAACTASDPPPLTAAHRRALGDTVLTIFDSVSAMHSAHPDTGILRRLHPPSDSLVFAEGGVIEVLTGDSLFRRVLALHVPVSAMSQRFTERRAQVVDRSIAILWATEDVDWVDASGPHQFHGQLTLVVTRRGRGWVIRSYHS